MHLCFAPRLSDQIGVDQTMTNSMVAVRPGQPGQVSAEPRGSLSDMKLWGPKEIKARFELRSRDTVGRWQQRDDFPEPVFEHGSTRFYDPAEIVAWHAAYKQDNPRKLAVLKLHRADPDRSNRSIAREVGCSPASVAAWLAELEAAGE